MSDCIEVHFTSGSIDEARKIVRFLVQERHVACAQLIPWVESVYMWDNQLHTTQESKVVMKTLKNKLDAIKELIKKNSTYEVPEITWMSIDGGEEEYINWLKESVLDKVNA